MRFCSKSGDETKGREGCSKSGGGRKKMRIASNAKAKCKYVKASVATRMRVTPQLRLILCAPQGKKIHVGDFGLILSSLEDLAMHLGSYLEGEPFREKGTRKKEILEKYALVISDIGRGSIDVLVSPSQDWEQATLAEDGSQLPGARVITKITDCIEAIGGGRSFDDVVDDIAYQNRVLDDVSGILPYKEGYTLRIKGHGKREFSLTSDDQSKIEGLRKEKARKTGNEIKFGVLADLRVVGEKMVKIERVEEEFAADYPPELGKSVRDLLGSPVQVFGSVVRDETTGKIHLFRIDAIKPFESIDLESFEASGKSFTPSVPTVVKVDFENEKWLLSIPSINAVGYGRRFEESLEALQSNIHFLWSEYVLSKPSSLGETGILLREILSRIFRVDL